MKSHVDEETNVTLVKRLISFDFRKKNINFFLKNHCLWAIFTNELNENVGQLSKETKVIINLRVLPHEHARIRRMT